MTKPNPTTVTLSDGLYQSHETKWPILYRIVAILLKSPRRQIAGAGVPS